MKKEFVSIERETVIGQLMAGFRREETLSLSKLDSLAAQLTVEEEKICTDTLCILKARSLYSSGKAVQAYNVLADGLRQMPYSISLQAERKSILIGAQNVLLELMHQDPMDPVIENLYTILKKESAIHAGHQIHFLQYLIGYQRYAEAAQIALPLVTLYPSHLVLKEKVEAIAQKVPNPVFTNYLTSQPARLGRKYLTTQLSANEVFVLSGKLEILRHAVRSNAPVHTIEKQVTEIIGKVTEDSPLQTELKEFYLVQAIVESRKENYYEALQLLRALVEMDPCHLNFRSCMNQEFENFCEVLTKQAQAGSARVDLPNAYLVLRGIGHVPYTLLTEVSLAEVKSGNKASAKAKMKALVALNPFDSDYVGAAQKVAEAAEDSEWLSDLQRNVARICEECPWALEFQLKVETLAKEDEHKVAA